MVVCGKPIFHAHKIRIIYHFENRDVNKDSDRSFLWFYPAGFSWQVPAWKRTAARIHAPPHQTLSAGIWPRKIQAKKVAYKGSRPAVMAAVVAESVVMLPRNQVWARAVQKMPRAMIPKASFGEKRKAKRGLCAKSRKTAMDNAANPFWKNARSAAVLAVVVRLFHTLRRAKENPDAMPHTIPEALGS